MSEPATPPLLERHLERDILIVDDEPSMRRMIARVLKAAGYAVHEAANGKEGIAAFRRILPALVITDIVMPDVEGIELIRTLRCEAATVPILAISGGGPALVLYLRAATSLGATASLEKPFSGDELLRAVNALLSGS